MSVEFTTITETLKTMRLKQMTKYLVIEDMHNILQDVSVETIKKMTKCLRAYVESLMTLRFGFLDKFC